MKVGVLHRTLTVELIHNVQDALLAKQATLSPRHMQFFLVYPSAFEPGSSAVIGWHHLGDHRRNVLRQQKIFWRGSMEGGRLKRLRKWVARSAARYKQNNRTH